MLDVIAVTASTWTRALGCLKVKLHTDDASPPTTKHTHLNHHEPTTTFVPSIPHTQKKQYIESSKMDALVAQYSRPAHAQAAAAEQQEDLDFTQDMPALSLKFAVPPVAQVRLTQHTLLHTIFEYCSKNYANLNSAFSMAPRNNRRPRQPKLPN